MKSNKKLYIGVGLLVILIAAGIGVHVRYSNRWYPGTKIEKIDVSGMTYEASINKIQKAMTSYQLKVKARDKGSLVINGSDIDLHIEKQEAVKQLYDKQHSSSVLLSFFSKGDKSVRGVLEYSSKKLKKIIKSSELIKGSKTYKIVKPEDATIVYSATKKYGVIQNEVLGNKIVKKQFITLVKDHVETLDKTIDITDTKKYPDIYKTPQLYHDDERLEEMQKTYNEYILHWIEWEMTDNVTKTIGPDTIKDYVKVNTEKCTVKFKTSKMEKLVEDFCLKYKTVGMKRKFKTHSGKVIKISGGDYGWQINYDNTLSKTLKELKKTPDESAIEAYMKKPTEANREPLTAKFKVKYNNKGYKYDYNDKQNDWNTKNYSEVDLSKQKVYVYRKGKLKFSCICITGRPTADRLTRTGVWYVKEKMLTKTLVGADYRVDTMYWVRIMWTGTGYHYSSRGDWGSWSPSYYQYAGSHGCVNLTYSNAKTIYGLVDSGDPVFIHK